MKSEWTNSREAVASENVVPKDLAGLDAQLERELARVVEAHFGSLRARGAECEVLRAQCAAYEQELAKLRQSHDKVNAEYQRLANAWNAWRAGLAGGKSLRELSDYAQSLDGVGRLAFDLARGMIAKSIDALLVEAKADQTRKRR